MARLKLDLPPVFDFTTEIALRIGDINYGGHLGNDTVLSLIHEARVRFFRHHGWSELDVEGVGIIMGDAAIVFKSEAFYGEVLKIDLAIQELETFNCDFLYRLTESKTNREIARAKTGIVFFDYSARKPARIPDRFRSLFQPRGNP